MARPVPLFASEQIAALIATAVAAILLVGGARRRRAAWAVPAARALAPYILAAFVTEHVAYALRGSWTLRLNLPLQLTHAVTLVSVAALWRPQVPLLIELVYVWALSASLQALITPTSASGSPTSST